MSNLNLDIDFPGHPKTRRLITEGGIEAVGALMLLWCYVAKYHPKRGEITEEWEKDEINEICKWKSCETDLKTILKNCGFIDEKSYRNSTRFYCHSWPDHQGHLVKWKERAKLAANARWGNKQCKDDATSIAQASTKQCPNLILSKLNQAKPKAEGRGSAGNPPTRKHKTGAERSELQGDCIAYVSKKLQERWPELTKETASVYAGYACKHLNTDAFSLEPEQFWWLLETKMNLPETPGGWYAFVGTSKGQIEMQWASDARNAVPLSPRSGQERIGI